jgi:hypothetical protein
MMDGMSEPRPQAPPILELDPAATAEQVEELHRIIQGQLEWLIVVDLASGPRHIRSYQVPGQACDVSVHHGPEGLRYQLFTEDPAVAAELEATLRVAWERCRRGDSGG